MLKAIIRVATPNEIPTIEIPEIRVMKRESFLEKPIAEKIIKELFEEEATNELQIVNNGTDPDDEEKDIKSKV